MFFLSTFSCNEYTHANASLHYRCDTNSKLRSLNTQTGNVQKTSFPFGCPYRSTYGRLLLQETVFSASGFHKHGYASAIEASFIALGLHVLSIDVSLT